MRFRKVLVMISAGALATAAACDPDKNAKPPQTATANVVAQRTSALVSAHIEQTLTAIERLDRFEGSAQLEAAMAELSALVGSIGGTPDEGAAEPGPAPDADPFFDPSTPDGSPWSDPSAPDAPDGELGGEDDSAFSEDDEALALSDFEPDPDAMRKLISERILNEANVETQTDNTVVFLLRGVVTCARLCETESDADGACEGAPDPECVRQIDAAQLRVAATTVGDSGVDLRLLVGPQKAAPIAFELRDGTIASELSLADLRSALLHIDATLADPAEEPLELPETMAGRVRIGTEVLSDADVAATLSITEDVVVEGDISSGKVSLRLAATTPTLRAHIDGEHGIVEVSLKVGPFDVSLPWSEVFPEGGDGTLALHLGGLSADVTMDAKDPAGALTLRDLGLGDSATTVKKDEDVLIQLDLNPDAGRTFTLAVEPGDEGQSALLTVVPELVLRLRLGLTPVQDLLEDDFPTALLEDTLTLALTGERGASVREMSETIAVVGGALSLTSAAYPEASVTVAENMCLGLVAVPAPGAHPVLGGFESQVCQ